ncbi:MAG: alkane 1-monooxygenase [Saprospiraceae bacterium]
MLKDLKYIIAYLTPASAFIAVTWQGGWSFSTVIIAFIIVPIIEQFAKGTERNLSAKEEEKKENAYFFDLLLYLNLPILYIILWCYFSAITNDPLTVWETVGVTMSVGVTLGGVGINVAHELGHRKKWYEQWMAKTLLTAALYTQFYIEHNRGHHLWVATDEDPSSARQGESLYQFWVRSIIGVYTHAWQLENGRLKKMGKSPFSLSNEMFWLQTAHLSYLIAVWSFFGWTGVAFAVVVATLAILQLETVNYIEHYGLRRKRLASGFYEKVGPHHSWNSNHEIGRILLYELTRHSDHHYKATRKYQVLRHFDESPQLPHGYPASMLMALIPPLWFSVMDKRTPTT